MTGKPVIPAEAGTQSFRSLDALDPRRRGDDGALPILGLMLGDVTGIGPEISARLLADGKLRGLARIAVIGDARVFALGCSDAKVQPAWRSYASVAAIDWSRDEIPVVDLGNIDPATLVRGEVSAESGRLTGETLQHMTQLAGEGEIDGICFAPLNKAALHRGGWKYADEHQMFAALNRHQGFFGEMNVIERFSTFRVTSHVALRQALEMITPERIASAVRLADSSLREAGHANPRIGVAALNPHCGENGLFGDEEIRIIAPTVRMLAEEGIACAGPRVVRRDLPEGPQGRVRRRGHDVPRPGADRDQAARLQQGRDGHRRTAHRLHHAGPRHRVRHRGPRQADTGALEQALRVAARMAAARRVGRGERAAEPRRENA
jgi:4-hydroxy-L-threonine phosphate dehydrogenase PdxA